MITTTYGLCLLAALFGFAALGEAYAQDRDKIEKLPVPGDQGRARQERIE
jgi:hypothetical protein